MKFNSLNGHSFQLKPKSLLARKIDKELKEEMKAWHERVNKKYMDFVEKHKKQYEKALLKDDYTLLPANIPESKEWLDDPEFRAVRFKKMAMASMEFDEPVPESLWASDELQYGVIELAWDFFTGERPIPIESISIR